VYENSCVVDFLNFNNFNSYRYKCGLKLYHGKFTIILGSLITVERFVPIPPGSVAIFNAAKTGICYVVDAMLCVVHT